MPLRKISLPAEPSGEQSQSTQRYLDRPTAIQIYQQVALNRRRELARTNISLAISGLAGGLAMGLTGLRVSIVRATLGDSPVAFLLYPMGFIGNDSRPQPALY